MNMDNKFTNTSVFGIDSATAMEYTYKFTEAGKYYYRCLLHSNMKGTITVAPGTAPTAQISGNATVQAGDPIVFSGESSQTFNEKTIRSYEWTAPSGSSQVNGAGSTFITSFPNAGTQTVTLKVTDSGGLTSETSFTVNVQPRPVTPTTPTTPTPPPSNIQANVDLASTPVIPTIGSILKKKQIRIGYSISGMGKAKVSAVFRSKKKTVASGSSTTDIPEKDGNALGKLSAKLTKSGRSILRGKNSVVLQLTLTIKDSKGQVATVKKNIQVFRSHAAVVTTP